MIIIGNGKVEIKSDKEILRGAEYYWCSKCSMTHRLSSKIGQEHLGLDQILLQPIQEEEDGETTNPNG